MNWFIMQIILFWDAVWNLIVGHYFKRMDLAQAINSSKVNLINPRPLFGIKTILFAIVAA